MAAGGVRAVRKNAPPREDVLVAAMATIAERGLEGLTMAGLGRQVGMSSGHLLYYFGSKDELLLQTLEWSEAALGAKRRALLSRRGSARERLQAYVDLYVPEGPGTRTGPCGWRSGTARRTRARRNANARPPSRAPGTATWWPCSPRESRAGSSGPWTPTASAPGCGPCSTGSASRSPSACPG